MARPTQDAIDMFVNITGASEAVAVQKLEEHNGDLNEAVNAHFSQGDRMSSSTTFTPTTRDDLMDIDDPINVETAVPALPPFSAIRRLNPFSVLESHFGHGRFDDGRADFISHAPRVSHPRNVRGIPIEFKDESPLLDSSGFRPKIEDVTGSVSSHGPEVHGTVIIDDDDDDDDDSLPSAPAAHGANHSVGVSARRHPTTNFSSLTDVTDYTNDIEEEMIQAAIEASKREAEEYGKQQYDASDSLAGSKHDTYVSEDSDLAHAVSLSLKTAERESFLRTQGENPFNAPASRPEYSGRTEISGGPLIANERQELEISKPQNSRQSSMNETDSSFQDDVDDDVDKEALHRSKHAVSGNTSSPSSSQQQGIPGHVHCNGNSFQSDEWGGLSTEEHDEAVMLEAAMFGGAPQGVSYEKFAYPHHQAIPTQYDRAPYPPSPRLAEQRLLREQQDDEYLASLHADREKELKAMQVAEKRRLEEAAAIEAALRREKNEEEEAHRKQLEEEEFERKLAAKQASLPGEPSADNENSVTLLIRMPDGSRCGRRFLKSDKLQLLYDYLDVGRLVKPGSYKLVRPYPRRPFANEESQLSLSDLGLTSKQEALFLELI